MLDNSTSRTGLDCPKHNQHNHVLYSHPIIIQTLVCKDVTCDATTMDGTMEEPPCTSMLRWNTMATTSVSPPGSRKGDGEWRKTNERIGN